MKEREDFDGVLIRAAKLLDDLTAYVTFGILTVLLVFTLWTAFDLSEFNSHGAEAACGRDLKELSKMNPDTAAWLRMDGTHIDYPVVKGRDNFEYLDLDINRNFYVGGTLFLDSSNRKDFSDQYNVIHGHHMADGIMFGDLDRFLDKEFAALGRKGSLKTFDAEYRLEVFAAGKVNAYDPAIYNTEADMDTHMKAIQDDAEYYSIKRRCPDKVLVLSTCTDDMDDSRTAVFCSMKRVSDTEIPSEVKDGR